MRTSLKIIMKNVMEDIFLKFIFNTNTNKQLTYHSYLKERCLKKSKSLFLIYMIYIIHIRSLKQALNNGIILKRVHRVIKFNQKDCSEPYIQTNTELRKKVKDNFQKDFFKLMNNAVFGKCEKT